MQFRNPYWTITEKIEILQRWILFHAYCYYELNTNYVSDKVYDDNAHQLFQMMKKHPSEALKSRYYNIYQGYDGNTGFFLIEALKAYPEIENMIKYDIEWFNIYHK